MLTENEIVVDQEEESAFEAGFNQTDLEPEESPTPEIEKQEEVVEQNEPVQEEVVAPTEPQITIEALRDMIEEQKRIGQQAHAKLSGTVGELKQKLDLIKNVSSGISPKARERLTNDFPELAEMLYDDEPVQPEPQKQEFTQAATYLTPQIDELKKELELTRLDMKHEDWRDVVRSQDFYTWKTSVIDPETSLKIDASLDSKYVSEKIAEFKEWHRSQLSALEKQQEGKRKTSERLNAAITPQGNPRDANNMDDNDEEKAMEEAFNKARRF